MKARAVLSLNNGGQLIGSCSYPFSDELPGKDYDCDHITPKNLWAFSHAQEFTGVSQEMLEEFVLPCIRLRLQINLDCALTDAANRLINK